MESGEHGRFAGRLAAQVDRGVRRQAAAAGQQSAGGEEEADAGGGWSDLVGCLKSGVTHKSSMKTSAICTGDISS
jgi:hypothetical protein